jgi:hypothetical protein
MPVNMRITVNAAALLFCVLGPPALQAADPVRTPLLSRPMHLDLDAARLRDRLAASMRPTLYRSGITIALTEKLDLATGIRNPGDTISPERLQFVTGLVWRF